MTVSSSTDRATFAGNGVAVAFSLPFRFFANSDVVAQAIVNSTGAVTPLTLGIDYLLTGAGQPEEAGAATGVLTTLAPVPQGVSLFVQRIIPVTQPTDIVNQARFFPEVHETVFDRLTMLIQQAGGESRGAIRVAVGDPEPARLPNATARALKLMSFDSFGNPIAVVPESGSAADLAIILASSTGTSNIGRGAGTLESSLDAIEADIAAVNSAGFLKQQNESVYALSEETIGDTTAFDTAIRAGAVTIAFAGDSIFEGLSQITYEDSPVGVIMRALREQNPDVVFTVGNFSLAGRGIGELASPTYVGIASPDNPATGFYHADSGPVYGLWPGGSVIGKSWLAHVRDFAPDLFIVAHGMNNTSGDGAAFATLLKDNILTVAAGWTKAPSIALVSTMLPSTTVSPFDTLQDEIQTTADVMRGVAQERNVSLYDANRRYLLLRDAVDVGNKKRISDAGFSGYPAGWFHTTGAFSQAANVLTGSGVTRRELVSDDCHVSAVFTLANYAAQTPAIWYRVEGSNQYTAQIAAGTTVILYYNGVPFASQAFPALTNGAPVRLEVDVVGARHRVFVNGVLRIDVYDYKRLRPGKHMLQIDGGSGTIADYSAQLGSSFSIGTPQFSEAELLGVNDWLTNQNSIGGNGVNHPSKLAATMVYGVAMAPLLRQTKRAKLSGSADIILATSNNSVTTFDSPANQSLSIRINGVGGLEGLVASTGAGSAIAVAESTKIVVGGSTIVVDAVLSSTGAVLPVNVPLPPGRWSVRALASFSRNGSGYRNYISVEATRVR